MTAYDKHRPRFGIALLAVGLAAFPAAGNAQSVTRMYSATDFREDASSRLSRHLRALANSPRSLDALLGAGNAALELGDPTTALTFFARAEEVAPRSGPVKAGMGSALVLMEQAPAALRYFAEAESLGARSIDFAGDRGLAYDLTGDPRRAQADYAVALRRGELPEVRRRLALSLAISGDREGALAAIDAQLRRQDRAAWRIRAFVLALTGDAAGATEATQAVMPQQAAAMRPFYARLPTLNPAQRAMAVHFGHFPGDGQPVQMAQNDMPSAQGGVQYAGVASNVRSTARLPDSSQPTVGRARPDREPQPTELRRSPTSSQILRERFGAGGTSNRRIAGVPQRTKPETKPLAPATARSAHALGDVPELNAGSAPATSRPPVVASASPGFSASSPTPAFTNDVPDPSVATPERAASLVAAPSDPGPILATSPTPQPRTGLADLAALIQALPDAASLEATPPAGKAASVPEKKLPFGPPSQPIVQTKEEPKPAALKVAAGTPTAKKPAAAKTIADKKAQAGEPKALSRIWVQIAGGANKAALPKEFTRLKGKAPDLLKGRTAWTAPLKATNRLLVGPFKTEKEAQSFVNELTKTGLTGFSWTSPPGEEVAKLSI